MRRVAIIFVAVFLVGLFAQQGVVAHAESPWFDGCITKYYGWGEGAYAEHGNDISCFSYATPVTALVSGVVTASQWTSFGQYTVTWRLDNPQAARGSTYAYFTDLSSTPVWTGEHVTTGQIVGYSLAWVEFGLTPDWAYGVSNWRWGIDSLFLIQEARNGYDPIPTATTYTAPPTVVTTSKSRRVSPPAVITRGNGMGGLPTTSSRGTTAYPNARILAWKYSILCHFRG